MLFPLDDPAKSAHPRGAWRLLGWILPLVLVCSSPGALATTPDSLEQALKTEMHDTLRVMRLIDLANLYRVSDHTRSISLLQQAYTLAEAADYPYGLMRALNGMGMVLMVQGNRADAIRHYLSALDIANNTNNVKSQIALLGNIGVLFDELHDSESAYHYFQMSVSASRLHGMKQAEANGLSNIGVLMLNQGKYDSAMHYLRLSLGLKQANRDSMSIPLTMNHIANAWLKVKQPDSAHAVLRQSLIYSLRKNNVHQKLHSYALLADAFLAQRKLDSARWYGEKCLKMSRLSRYDARIVQSLEVLSRIVEAQGHPAEALGLLRQRLHITDSLVKAESRMIAYNLKDDIRLRNSMLTLKTKSQRQSQAMGWLIAGVVLLVCMGAGLVVLIAARTRANTRLRAMRQELQTLNLELEHRVKERTAQLEARNTQLETYAYHTSHRLRAPLATLLGLIDVLKLYPVPADIQRRIDGIDQTAQALDEVVHDINDSLSGQAEG